MFTICYIIFLMIALDVERLEEQECCKGSWKAVNNRSIEEIRDSVIEEIRDSKLEKVRGYIAVLLTSPMLLISAIRFHRRMRRIIRAQGDNVKTD